MSYFKYFLALLLVLSCPAQALKTIYLPSELQTQTAKPIARKIYLKLPLQQADSDWIFIKDTDLLAGTLELKIIRNNQLVEDIIVFQNGALAQGWEAVVPPIPTPPNALYFGFRSTKRYLTAPGDKLELKLQITKSVKGIGPDSSGVLAKGVYVTSGIYSGLIDQFDLKQANLYKTILQNKLDSAHRNSIMQALLEIYSQTAFLNAWSNQWPLVITTNSGWLDEYEQAENNPLT